MRRTRQNDDDFPVIVTSYEICILDRAALSHFKFKYLVIDEGQRVKNRDCRLVRELKKLNTENRLLLSGTPIQNTLEELWSLLNFVNPQIFDDLAVFQSWFGFRNIGQETQVDDIVDDESKDRRVRGVLLFVSRHRRASSVSEKALGGFFSDFGPRRRPAQDRVQAPRDPQALSLATGQGRRPQGRPPAEEGDSCIRRDDASTKNVRSAHPATPVEGHAPVLGHPLHGQGGLREQHVDESKKKCEPPVPVRGTYHTYRRICTTSASRFTPSTRLVAISRCSAQVGEANPKTLINASGKFRLLDRLLVRLKEGGHKVLLFSQMTELLNIIEDYVRSKQWGVFRIDGGVELSERQRQIDAFNAEGQSSNNHFIFLLSTRAGGLGINLASADTVVLFDSDWNPHQDSQAMDRAHRIGQTKPVVVYRLLTTGSVEISMMEKQISKKKLERMAVTGGDYNKAGRRSRGDLTTDGLRALLDSDVNIAQRVAGMTGDDKEALGDDELELVLDREKIFSAKGIPTEGKMYDVVAASGGGGILGNLGDD